MFSTTKKLSSFPLSFFPVPQFLMPPVAGVDVSDHAIRFMQFVLERHGLRLASWDCIALPHGALENGEIKDEKIVLQALKELRQKYHIVEINASLPMEKAYHFRLELPGSGLSRKEIRRMIEPKLEESIPLVPQEAIFDFTVVGEHSGMTDLSVIALQAQLVEGYLLLFRRAGFAPQRFEVEPDALARAVIARTDKSASLMLDLGKFKTSLSMVLGGVAVFTAVIEMGGDTLTSLLEQELHVSHEKAENIKQEKGFHNTEKNKKIHDILRQPLAALCDEIKKHLSYWNVHISEHHEHGSIGRIVLCGGGANLKGLSGFLSQELSIEVRCANVWINAFQMEEHIPPITFEESLRYATAIGLALAR